jgi:tripartite ATP-independent transporter DctP family solute receptor
MRMLKRLSGFMIIAVLLVGSAPMAAAQVRFRFAHTINPADAQNLAVEQFVKKVAERTNNAVQIQVFPAGQLGNDMQILDGVKLGTIDIGMTGNPFFTTIVPELNLFDLPYLFRNFDHAYKVLDGPIGAEVRQLLEKHGMKPIGILEIGFRNVTNNKHQVKVPEDLKGLRLRTTPNPAHIQAFRLLGANPVPMPITEVYLALSTGTVDGQENPIAHIYDMKFYEVQKYLSLTYHAYTAANVVMNLKKYQELKPEHQKILQASLLEATNWERKLNRELDGKALAKMKAAGMQIEENPDREAFRKIVADPTADEYVKKFGRDLLDQVRKAY